MSLNPTGASRNSFLHHEFEIVGDIASKKLRLKVAKHKKETKGLDNGINGVCLRHHNAVQRDFYASLHVDTGFARVHSVSEP